MPLYEYQCEDGHVTERFRNMRDEHPSTIECDWCGFDARRIYSTPVVVDDFPEHYNISMDCVVKNRADHKRKQKEMGLQDWEPVKESPGTSKMKKLGLI